MPAEFILSQSELDYQSVACSNNHNNRSLNCVLNNIYILGLSFGLPSGLFLDHQSSYGFIGVRQVFFFY